MSPIAAHATHATHAAAHAAHAAAHAAVAVAVPLVVLLLGDLGDEARGGQQQRGHAGGVLQGRADDLGRVDDAGLDQVAVLRRCRRRSPRSSSSGGRDGRPRRRPGRRCRRSSAAARPARCGRSWPPGPRRLRAPELSTAFSQRNRATPPPGTMPSSRAAWVAALASSSRAFRSFISVSVAAPTLIWATPPASFASRSWSFSRS